MKRILLFLLPLLVFLLSARPLMGQIKMPPRNEMHQDSSLTAFICKLQYAIYKKDTRFLLSVVDKNIKNSFGGSNGIEEFKSMWELDKPDSEVWFYLSKLISLGGTFGGDAPYSTFILPYVFSMDLPNDTLDPFSVMVVTGEGVNVREKPDKSAKVLGQLSYEVVEVDYEKSYPSFQEEKIAHLSYYGTKEWYYVTTLNQKLRGYVYWDYIWSPIDYRLFLEKKQGQWKITILVAGD
ncbi:MAG: SH3 domain-containing protein [Bacteroidetes bacterium]|nr:MAG: SH3 domain-containing protein [Bacteroidota bacterium]